MGQVIFITTISLFHFSRNRQHPETGVSFKNFFRKCECIRSCYFPILSNLLKISLRKTSLFVLFELLPYLQVCLGMCDLLLPHSMNGLVILCFCYKNINKEVGEVDIKLGM